MTTHSYPSGQTASFRASVAGSATHDHVSGAGSALAVHRHVSAALAAGATRRVVVGMVPHSLANQPAWAIKVSAHPSLAV